MHFYGISCNFFFFSDFIYLNFLFCLVSLAKGLLIFAYIFKELNLSYIKPIFFFQSLFKLLFSLSYYSSFRLDFFSLILNFVCSLSSFFSCKITLFTWNLFISFSRQTCITNNFPLRTTLAVLHRIWYAIFLF